MIQATRCIICQENEKSSKLLSYVLSDYLAKGTLSALKRSALCEILNFYLDQSRPKNNHHQENFRKILSVFIISALIYFSKLVRLF